MSSDDVETAQTVVYMDQLAAKDCNDGTVAAAVDEALNQAQLTHHSPAFDKACAVFWWLKRTIRYVPTPGTSLAVDQTLIAPTATLAMPEPIGDCPQFSMLAAAMFRVLCMDCRYVTIAASTAAPEQWSHVYNTVEIFPGQFMPFDASEGPEPGAEYANPYKKKIWPKTVAGKCVTRETSRDMIRRSHTMTGMRNSSLRTSMGDLGDTLCDDTGCYDSATGSTFPAPPPIPGGYGYEAPVDLSVLNASIAANTPMPAAPTTGSASPAWLNTLINDATSLVSPIVKQVTQQQPYYIAGPNGQSVLYNPVTGTVQGSGVSLSTINPTVIMLGLGALALFAFMGSGSRR